MALANELPHRKKPVNLTVDESLLKEAQALKLNLSKTFQAALEEAVREENRRRWLAENRESIEDYNVRIARQGVFSDGLRRF